MSLEDSLDKFMAHQGKVIDILERQSSEVTKKMLKKHRKKFAFRKMLVEVDGKLYVVSRHIGFPNNRHYMRRHQLLLVLQSYYTRSFIWQQHLLHHGRSPKWILNDVVDGVKILNGGPVAQKVEDGCYTCRRLRQEVDKRWSRKG